MQISMLSGGDDPNYAVPLASSLARRGIRVDFIGNDAMASAEGLKHRNIHYLNLRGSQHPSASISTKVARIVRYYGNLLSYAASTESSLFHILWLNKFEVVDRTLVNAFYKLNRKKLVFTAHNVNARKRDGGESWTNRTSLRAMYSMLDHIFVHTDHSRDELVGDFGVAPARITVIPFGLNTYTPGTPLSKSEARARLSLGDNERVLLFFGQIAPYKGLDILLEAMTINERRRPAHCRLLIAGRAKSGFESQWEDLKRTHVAALGSRVIVKDDFVPDDEVAVLFKAADALVLPYRAIYQSGPLSLAHRFGVPVLATRIGTFEHDVIPRVTGLLCTPQDPAALAGAIVEFFESDLYIAGEQTQKRIQELALQKYSWERISETIVTVYAELAGGAVC